MLTEARARMVDVETGERPRAMRPLDADPPPAASREGLTPRSPEGGAVKRSPEPRPTVAEKRGGDVKSRAGHEVPAADGKPTPVDADEHSPVARPDSDASPLGTDGVLWLEDSPREGSTPADDVAGDAKARPWRRGLRG
jgi:hypothetical protein